jgi:hypothetical protein
VLGVKTENNLKKRLFLFPTAIFLKKPDKKAKIQKKFLKIPKFQD